MMFQGVENVVKYFIVPGAKNDNNFYNNLFKDLLNSLRLDGHLSETSLVSLFFQCCQFMYFSFHQLV